MEGQSCFDATIVRDVAAAHEREASWLDTQLARHQRSMASLPGIEDLVYEWRKQYGDVVLSRTPEQYVVTVPDWVWGEFADALCLETGGVEPLVEVHRRQVVMESHASGPQPVGESYLVLDRTVTAE
jgi:hypothetical protein